MNSLFHLIGDIAIWVALLAAVAFCVTYATVAPWRSSGEGWHLMAFTAVIGVAFGWIAYRQTWHAAPPAAMSIEIPRALILSALAAVLLWRLALLIQAQIRRRNRAMTRPAPDFEPPPANEPIPQPRGATDADMDGVDVTDQYLDAEGRALAAGTAVATWTAVLAKARSYLGTYPPGRVKENVNTFTKAYYGNSTVAAWCFIFIWYVLNSFGDSALIGGKQAYVPWIDRISGYRRGHSGVKVGAITAVNDFNHIGFCVRVGGGTFDLLSGNSTKGSSSDAITVKQYSTSVISGYVNVKYTDAPVVDDSDDFVVMVIAS